MPAILSDKPYVELLDGVKYPKVGHQLTHSLVRVAIVAILKRCAADRGYSLFSWRFRLSPDTEFVPDACFVSFDRLEALPEADQEEPPFAPDIAIEVRSPMYRAEYNSRKISKYLDHGSLLVLDIDPARRTILVHAKNTPLVTLSGTESFENASVPWLRFNVASVFFDLDLIGGFPALRGSHPDTVDEPTQRRLLSLLPGIEIEGFRIVINTRDERGHKAHVHVIKGREKCKIVLDAVLTPYDIQMTRPNVRRARELVAERFAELLGLWEKFNG